MVYPRCGRGVAWFRGAALCPSRLGEESEAWLLAGLPAAELILLPSPGARTVPVPVPWLTLVVALEAVGSGCAGGGELRTCSRYCGARSLALAFRRLSRRPGVSQQATGEEGGEKPNVAMEDRDVIQIGSGSGCDPDRDPDRDGDHPLMILIPCRLHSHPGPASLWQHPDAKTFEMTRRGGGRGDRRSRKRGAGAEHMYGFPTLRP